MKKTISLVLIALTVTSFTAIAEPRFKKGERLDLEEKAAPIGHYSGKYRLQWGKRIELNPEERAAPQGYYSGNYRFRQGQRILISKK